MMWFKVTFIIMMILVTLLELQKEKRGHLIVRL